MTDYVELHCHSYFSLLDGAASPEILVQQAAALGMSALALTDHDAVYGAIRFQKAAQVAGIRPIWGAEITLEGGYHLTLLVANTTGWHNLCTLITLAQHHAPKGESSLPLEILADYTSGLIALSGCRRGEIVTALQFGDVQSAHRITRRYQDWFGADRFWIELQHHRLPDDDTLNRDLVMLATDLGLGYVATNNVHYATRAGHRLQDVLVCIRHQTTLDQSSGLCRPNSEYYLKSGVEMTALFAGYPAAITNTRLIADQCNFDLGYGLQELPQFPTPPNLNARQYLYQLCRRKLSRRYTTITDELQRRLDYELAVIERGGLSNYFLIVWDMVRYARDNNIRCQGRGSAANSLVAYILGITPIDPLAHDLVFERFLSDERQVVPDIDIDFDAARREEVIQYVYERYGHQHAAMACTYVTFRPRSAIRDVGKALELPISLIEQVSKSVDHRQVVDVETNEAPIWQHLFDLCQQIQGSPRHLGIHNGGMVITGAPLAERVPTEPATMPDRVVVQWDKDSLEDAGLVKIDILGLRMISAIAGGTGSYRSSDRHTP